MNKFTLNRAFWFLGIFNILLWIFPFEAKQSNEFQPRNLEQVKCSQQVQFKSPKSQNSLNLLSINLGVCLLNLNHKSNKYKLSKFFQPTHFVYLYSNTLFVEYLFVESSELTYLTSAPVRGPPLV